ncbi:MAG TPA: SRPBCC family protein [Mycobacterium sp.]|uniref:SRPBCC family protein n=1 Tax=Mycobacterium sp. TaxID=1785 RepID=UPI002B82D0F9|nr:SRPBCC family protein [Mycobacterium sp.]HME76019.1 SRPBCC family protein [Mycobacterium sp.]
MSTDSASETVQIEAPFAEVLATIRDVESQAEWIPEILEVELLEVYEENDLPATARFKASATVGTDGYTLSYEHQVDA